MKTYSTNGVTADTPMAPGPSKRANASVAPAKLNKWQVLVNQYGNRLGTGESFSQSTNQSIEEEFIAYSTSRVVQTDILQFWAVSLQSSSFKVYITPKFSLGKRAFISYYLQNCHGFLADPGIISSLRKGIFFKCGNRHKETKSNL
jgi:hypothetical protein